MKRGDLRWKLAGSCGFAGLAVGEEVEHVLSVRWKWHPKYLTYRALAAILAFLFLAGCAGGIYLAYKTLELRGLV